MFIEICWTINVEEITQQLFYFFPNDFLVFGIIIHVVVKILAYQGQTVQRSKVIDRYTTIRKNTILQSPVPAEGFASKLGLGKFPSIFFWK